MEKNDQNFEKMAKTALLLCFAAACAWGISLLLSPSALGILSILCAAAFLYYASQESYRFLEEQWAKYRNRP